MSEGSDNSREKGPSVAVVGVIGVLAQKKIDWIAAVLGMLLLISGIIGGIPKIQPFDSATSTKAMLGGVFLLVVAGAIALFPRLLVSARSADGNRMMQSRHVATIMLVVSLLVALTVGAAFFDLIPWPRTDRLHEAADMVIVGLAIASWFGFIPAYMTASALANLPDTIEKHVQAIKIREEELIGQVEDATRATLNTFARIFAKALWMVDNAQRELIFVNFAMSFGHPHLNNKTIVDEYQTLPRELPRTGVFSTDVGLFRKRLRDKVGELDYVQILTVSDPSVIEKFLRPLQKQSGYTQLDVLSESDALKEAKADIQDRIELEMKGVPLPHPKRLVETTTIPIQVLIAGLPPREGSSAQRTGCLVLMTGSEILKEGRPSGGFYTELETMVGMFRDLAVALIEDGYRRHPKGKSE